MGIMLKMGAKNPTIARTMGFISGTRFHKGHEQIQYLSGSQLLVIFTF